MASSLGTGAPAADNQIDANLAGAVRVQPSSPDFQTELASQIAALVPEVMADGKIDLEVLRGLLDDAAAGPLERFGLVWPGKREAQRVAQAPTTATLEPDRDNSRDWDTTQNVVIEGDNLEVLKVLQRHYFGQIKMIYIDPPYNTGKDFVYKDDYHDGVGHYLEWTEQVTASGKTSTNVDTAGRFHSNWLNMMYPRLKLARNLLSEDGVIFISIDDSERANLKVMCDELFGEHNFIASFAWEKTQHFGRQKTNSYSNYDTILCYARNLTDENGAKKELLIEFEKSEFEDAPLYNSSNPESVITFPAGSTVFNIPDGTYEAGSDSKYHLLHPVTVKNGRNVEAFSLRFCSRWAANTILEEHERGCTYWVKSTNFAVRVIYGQGKTSHESPREIIFTSPGFKKSTKSRYGVPVGTNEEGSAEVCALVGKGVFSYPKPTSLIAYLISLHESDLILDFFAGSGTTAHAVMQLNAEDGGNRRCISVQLPEPTPLDGPARGAGFETISQITRERVRRAGDKILSDQAAKLSNRSTPLDVGFRAYRLSDTHFRKWGLDSGTSAKELETQLALGYDSAKDTATPEELFTEVLLKQGLSLTESYETTSIAGLEIFSIEDGLIMGYFNEHVTPTLDQLRELIATAPGQLFILEDAFAGSDELKANLAQLCASRGIDLVIA